MSVRQRVIGSLAAMVGFMLIAGCGGSAGRQPHLGETIRIGLNLELTGDLAWYGDSALQGAQVAVDSVNATGGIGGRPIEMVVESNGSQAGRTVALSAKLMTQDKALAVLGPATENLFRATATVADKHEIAAVSTLACSSDVLDLTDRTPHPYVFRSCLGYRQQGSAMANFAVDRLAAQTALVLRFTEGGYGDFADGFSERFTAAGGQVISDDVIVPEETDLWRYATQLQQTPSDVVYVAAPAWETGHLIAQLRQSGLSQPVLGIDELDDPALVEAAGVPALNSVYFSTDYAPWDSGNPRVQQFIETFRNTWDGAEPSRSSALAHDAALMIMDAIRRADAPTGVKVQQALLETQGLSGVTGRLRVTADHETIKDALIVELIDGAPGPVISVAP